MSLLLRDHDAGEIPQYLLRLPFGRQLAARELARRLPLVGSRLPPQQPVLSLALALQVRLAAAGLLGLQLANYVAAGLDYLAWLAPELRVLALAVEEQESKGIADVPAPVVRVPEPVVRLSEVLRPVRGYGWNPNHLLDRAGDLLEEEKERMAVALSVLLQTEPVHKALRLLLDGAEKVAEAHLRLFPVGWVGPASDGTGKAVVEVDTHAGVLEVSVAFDGASYPPPFIHFKTATGVPGNIGVYYYETELMGDVCVSARAGAAAAPAARHWGGGPESAFSGVIGTLLSYALDAVRGPQLRTYGSGLEGDAAGDMCVGFVFQELCDFRHHHQHGLLVTDLPLKHNQTLVVLVNDMCVHNCRALTRTSLQKSSGGSEALGVGPGTRFGRGDTIGVGINYVERKFVVTRNGVLVAEVPCEYHHLLPPGGDGASEDGSTNRWVPLLSCWAQQLGTARARTNFGTYRPFAYDICGYVQRMQRGAYAEIFETSLKASLGAVRRQLDEVVYDFFVHRGYGECAAGLARDMERKGNGVVVDETHQTEKRQEVRRMILGGRASEAWAYAQREWPEAVADEAAEDVWFQLQMLHLVELVTSMDEDGGMEAVEYCQGLYARYGLVLQHQKELRDVMLLMVLAPAELFYRTRQYVEMVWRGVNRVVLKHMGGAEECRMERLLVACDENLLAMRRAASNNERRVGRQCLVSLGVSVEDFVGS